MYLISVTPYPKNIWLILQRLALGWEETMQFPGETHDHRQVAEGSSHVRLERNPA